MFIIGKPDPVYLTCVISLLYTIQCNWNTPYTLQYQNIILISQMKKNLLNKYH